MTCDTILAIFTIFWLPLAVDHSDSVTPGEQPNVTCGQEFCQLCVISQKSLGESGGLGASWASQRLKPPRLSLIGTLVRSESNSAGLNWF